MSKNPGRMRRILFRLLIALAVVVVTVALALAVVCGTAGGRDWLTTTVTENVSDPEGFNLSLTGLGEGFPSRIALETLYLGDAQGMWLEIEEVELRLSIWALLRGVFDVENLSARRLLYTRNPDYPEEEEEEEEEEDEAPFDWKTDLPTVFLHRLLIEELELGEELVPVPSRYRVRGDGQIGDWESARIKLLFDLLPADEEQTGGRAGAGGDQLGLSLDLVTRDEPIRFEGELRVEEPADGLIAALLVEPLGLAAADALSATLQLSGPLEHQAITLTAKVADQAAASLEGELKFDDDVFDADVALSLTAPVVASLGEADDTASAQISLTLAAGRLDVKKLELIHGSSAASAQGNASWKVHDPDDAPAPFASLKSRFDIHVSGADVKQLSQDSISAIDAELDGSFDEGKGRGVLTAMLEGAGKISATLESSPADVVPANDGAVAFVLKAEAELAALFTKLGLGGVDDPVNASFEGLFSPDQRFVLEQGELRLGEASIDFGADIDLMEMGGTVHASLLKGRSPILASLLEPLASVSLEAFDFEGHVENLKLLDADASFSAELTAREIASAGISVGNFSLQLKGDREGQPDGQFNVGLVAGADGCSLEKEPLPLLGAAFDLAVQGKLAPGASGLVVDSLKLDGEQVDVAGTGSAKDAWTLFSADLQVDIAELASLEPLLGSAIEGRGKANLELGFSADTQQLNIIADSSLSALIFDDPVLNQLVGERVSLAAAIKGKQGAFQIEKLSVQAAELRVSGVGSCTNECQNIEAEAQVLVGDRVSAVKPDDVAPEDTIEGAAPQKRARKVAKAFPGGLSAKLSASGALTNLQATISAEGGSLRFGGTSVEAFQLDSQVDRDGDASAARLAGGITLAGNDFQIAGLLAHDGGSAARVEGFSIVGPETAIEATAAMDLEAGHVDGKVHLDLGDLGLFAPLIDGRLGGHVALDIDLAGSAATGQGARFVLSADGLRVGQASGALTEIARVGGTGTFANLTEKPTGEVHFEIVDVAAADWVLPTVTLDAQSDPSLVWQTQFKAEATLPEDVLVDAAVSLHGLPTLSHADLSSFTMRVGSVPIALRESVRLSFGESFVLEPASFTVAESGSLNAAAKIAGGTIEAKLQGGALPLSLLAIVEPEIGLQGNLEFDVDASGRLDSPQVTARALLSDVSNKALLAAELAPLSVEVHAEVDRGLLDATVALAGLSDTELLLGARLAVLGSAIESEPMLVSVVGDLNLGDLFLLLPSGGNVVEGRLSSDLTLTGTSSQPRVDGRLELRDGYLESGDAGTVISELEIDAVAHGTRVVLDRFEGFDGSKGTIGGEGYFEMGRLPAYEFELSVIADKATLVRLDLVDAKAGGSVTVRGSKEEGAPAALELLGRVEIDRATITIPSRFAADRTALDVTEVKNGQPLFPEAEDAGAGQKLEMNLRLHADNRIYVRGRGLDSEWKTGLFISGTGANPRINGHLTVVRGDLDLLGKRFELTKGVVTFNGKPDVPYIELRAEADAGEVTAFVDIHGTPSDIEIDFSSDPGLPRDEVLARVLFGESATELTPIQSVKLAQSLAALSGRGGGNGLFGKIGSGLGLDSLGVDMGAGSLSVSKYITEDVYLHVVQGLTPESSRVQVEWELMKNLSLQSETGQASQGKVGLNWRYDY